MMAFFLGLMKIPKQVVLLQIIARLLRPLMELIFRGFEDHPAMGAMIMNILLAGVGLAPLWGSCLQGIDKLNPGKGFPRMPWFFLAFTSSVLYPYRGIARASRVRVPPALFPPPYLHRFTPAMLPKFSALLRLAPG
ncbi:MAG: hypothetical protein H0A75_03010 [Candidatus Methanofishera endochildressiae]|uniref:Uncharacterized protein n=1 Tax=Candidatus Methanofishera endochildressiae TaxID=2738884 RepID=A0A7Z0MN43_9GAMM|nr:hypothetical protein [Candidatus Methanofishera endochildressiae]